MTALAAVAVAVVGCGEGAITPAASNTPAPTFTTVAKLGPASPGTSIFVGSTVAPPLPAPVDSAVEEAVKKGVQDFFAAYMACGQAPAECHPGDFHSERGTAVGQGTVYFNGLNKRGWYFAADLRGSYIVTQSVALENPTSAIAFSCWYDASTLLGPLDANGEPTVLNDKIISVRQKQNLFFDGADWKVGEAAPVEDLGDGNKCPPPDPPG
jgi:hypothetical protein